MSNIIIKVGGAATAAAGALILVQEGWALAVGGLTEGVAESAVHTGWVLLLIFGVLGIHGLQARRGGAFGQVAALTAVFGLVWLFAAALTEVTMLPALPADSPLRDQPPPAMLAVLLGSFALYVFGLLMFAAAIWRANVLPRRAAVLLAISVPFGLAMGGVIPGGALAPMGIAYVWLGIATLRTTSSDVAPARVGRPQSERESAVSAGAAG